MSKPKRTSGSVVDISLWLDRGCDPEPLLVVVERLLHLGATPNGDAYVHAQQSVTEPFQAVSDHLTEQRPFHGMDDLQTLADSRSDRLVACWLDDVLTVNLDVAVEVRCGLTRFPSHRHPIQIVFPEDEIYGVVGSGRKPEALEALARLFDSLVIEVNPAYAGVFVEYSMPAPRDISSAEGYFFDWFFLRESFIGSTQLEQIESLAGDAAKRTRDGLMVRLPTHSETMGLAVARSIAHGVSGRH
jgi:hypothetical protein